MDLIRHNQIVEKMNIKYLDEIEILKDTVNAREDAIEIIMKENTALMRELNRPITYDDKKRCSKCGRVKPLIKFGFNYHKKTGKKIYKCRCQKCDRKHRRKYKKI